MTYEIVYESWNVHEYYKVVDFLTDQKIEFQKLHEYRLDPAKNHDTSDPAFIRVPASNHESVRSILIENGFINSNGNFNGEEQALTGKSEKDENYLEPELGSLIGQEITSVKYVLANYSDYLFNEYHLIDQSILIEFSNNKFLLWNFVEMDFDFEEGFYLPDRYELKLLDQHPELHTDFNIKKVSDSQEWTSFNSSSVRSIEIYTQDYQYSPEVKTEKIVTEIVIKTDYDVCAIYSVEEPDPEIKGTTKKPSFKIYNGWTLVVFDPTTVKEIEKIRN